MAISDPLEIDEPVLNDSRLPRKDESFIIPNWRGDDKRESAVESRLHCGFLTITNTFGICCSTVRLNVLQLNCEINIPI